MKKIILLALMLVLVSSLFVAYSEIRGIGSVTFAADGMLPLNTPLNTGLRMSRSTGSFNGSFTLPSDGLLILRVNNTEKGWGDPIDYLFYSLSTEAGSSLYSGNFYTGSFRALRLPAGNYSLSAGVPNSVSDLYWTSQEFTLGFTPEDDSYEHEWNDDFLRATRLQINSPIKGNIHQTLAGADKDYYHFEIPESGKVLLNIKHHTGTDDRDAFYIHVYDSNEILQGSLVSSVSQSDLDSDSIRLAKGEYYVEVMGDYDYQYVLTVNFAPEPVGTYEQEPNDKQNSASFIEPGKTITGNLNNENDADWYAIRIAEAGMIDFTFTHSRADYGNWKIVVQDELGNIISESDAWASETTKILTAAHVKPGLRFVIVTKSTAFSGVDYSLATGFTPAEKLITLRIGDQSMTVNGEKKEIDPGRGTAPMIVDSRTLVPIRAIVEEFGGNVEWDGGEQKVTLVRGGTAVEMWINRSYITINGTNQMIDVAPRISNGRTYVPLRFVSENLGVPVSWENATRTVTLFVYDIAVF